MKVSRIIGFHPMGKAQNISQRYKASIPHKLGISKLF